MKPILIFFLSLAFVFQASAQGYQLGQKVTDFTLKDAATGKNVSLKDFTKEKTVVVVFTNDLCPYSELYENRLLSLSKTYSPKGAKFLLINPSISSADGEESVAAMAEKAKNWSNLPYLADEGKAIAKRFGATKTPEVFVLHNVNGEFVVKYKGAIDDNPQVENYVNDNYLKNAIDALLSGQNIKTVDKRATGCLIK